MDFIQIQEFIQGMKDYPLHSNGLLNAPKVLSDIIESIIGAIFIDCNCSLDIVWKVKFLNSFMGGLSRKDLIMMN